MAAERPIPVYTDLTEVFGNLGTSLNHVERWNDLATEFENRFGKKPAYIVRAPGRVNLIGEHIDYALFGVFPAAIERDILIACARRDLTLSDISQPEVHHLPGSVIADNLHAKYSRQVFAPAPKDPSLLGIDENQIKGEGWHLDIDTKELRWENYIKAGYHGVLDYLFSNKLMTNEQPVAVDLLVAGTVPAGSGLSSSAALIVASSLAFLAINGKLDHHVASIDSAIHQITKGELVELAIASEKRVGVNTGGMDQAASVISDPSSALYISFYPKLAASPVPLPSNALFVCANSLVVSDKAVTAKHRYNLRVVETLVGARILGTKLGLVLDAREKITFREVVGRLAHEEGGQELSVEKLQESLEAVIKSVDVLKPRDHRDASDEAEAQLGLTMEEMIHETGLPRDVFHDVYLSWVDVEATHFQIYKRAKHVLSESLRVLHFRKICLDASTSSSTSVPQLLGELMNASQASCASLFECSCHELDLLTQLAREAGAYGSRLTGAGWGGCIVSLVAEDKVESFIAQLKENYPPYKKLNEEELAEVIFATKPSSGACVYKFK
ncbi:Galactokinase [Amanita muscaria]